MNRPCRHGGMKKSVLTRCQRHLTVVVASGEKHVFLSTAAEQRSAAAEELVRNALLIFPSGRLSALKHMRCQRSQTVLFFFYPTFKRRRRPSGSVRIFNPDPCLWWWSNAAIAPICMKQRDLCSNCSVLDQNAHTHTHKSAGQVWGQSVFPFVPTQCHIKVTDRHWPSPYGLRWTPEIKMDLGLRTFALGEKAQDIHQNDTQRSFSLDKWWEEERKEGGKKTGPKPRGKNWALPIRKYELKLRNMSKQSWSS